MISSQGVLHGLPRRHGTFGPSDLQIFGTEAIFAELKLGKLISEDAYEASLKLWPDGRPCEESVFDVTNVPTVEVLNFDISP